MSDQGNKVVIQTDQAPAPIGPYSQAIKANDLIYVSGQLGIDPKTGQLVGPDIASQTRQVLENLQSILSVADSGLGRVVKSTIYVTDINDFSAMNEIYGEYFTFEPPARSTVQVAALPMGASVEIDVIALPPKKSDELMGGGDF
jgi:2-iminobutanoate/2-iminopropanoate deaminase